jgi:hypothetical protein
MAFERDGRVVVCGCGCVYMEDEYTLPGRLMSSSPLCGGCGRGMGRCFALFHPPWEMSASVLRSCILLLSVTDWRQTAVPHHCRDSVSILFSSSVAQSAYIRSSSLSGLTRRCRSCQTTCRDQNHVRFHTRGICFGFGFRDNF